MKQHVKLFESFMDRDESDYEFGGSDFGSSRDYRSHNEMSGLGDEDSSEFQRAFAAKASILIGKLTKLANDFDVSEPEVRLSALPFLTKYFTSRGVNEEDVETFVKVLGRLSFRANEKKKADQDGDGDTDFVDAKVAQYKAGGLDKQKAIAKAKIFAKKNNIKDSKKSSK
jgi:hypothetical protein